MTETGKSQTQRRGRKKRGKPLSDKAWISLFKYNARALRLRSIASSIMMSLVKEYGEDWFSNNRLIVDNHGRIMYNDLSMFIEYWHSSLEIVLEAYEKYALKDESVDDLLDMPLRKKLKVLRNNSFHFREDYESQDVLSFFWTEGAFEWTTKLQEALHNFMEKEGEKLRERSGITVSKVTIVTK